MSAPVIATVAGIERHAIMRQADFFIAVRSDGFEVLFSINGQPRRMAFCFRESDAQAIVTALRLAHEAGAV